MFTKKSLRVVLIVLIIIFVIAIATPFTAFIGQPPVTFDMVFSSINWYIFAFLFILVVINLALYMKAKE